MITGLTNIIVPVVAAVRDWIKNTGTSRRHLRGDRGDRRRRHRNQRFGGGLWTCGAGAGGGGLKAGISIVTGAVLPGRHCGRGLSRPGMFKLAVGLVWKALSFVVSGLVEGPA